MKFTTAYYDDDNLLQLLQLQIHICLVIVTVCGFTSAVDELGQISFEFFILVKDLKNKD